MGRPPIPVELRFHTKYYVDENTGCWNWTGKRQPRGYGAIRTGTINNRDRKTSLASRISWELHHGPIPDGLLVCHHCDNPRCVNPNHLFVGTQSDNMLDSSRKGRSIRGELNVKAKLKEKDVFQIRKSKRTNRELAKQYGVCIGTIQSIKSVKTWRHLP